MTRDPHDITTWTASALRGVAKYNTDEQTRKHAIEELERRGFTRTSGWVLCVIPGGRR